MGSGVVRVFTVTNNTVMSRVVQTGRIVDRRQEVLSGLRVGDRVVTSGQSKLSDGIAVRIKE